MVRISRRNCRSPTSASADQTDTSRYPPWGHPVPRMPPRWQGTSRFFVPSPGDHPVRGGPRKNAPMKGSIKWEEGMTGQVRSSRPRTRSASASDHEGDPTTPGMQRVPLRPALTRQPSRRTADDPANQQAKPAHEPSKSYAGFPPGRVPEQLLYTTAQAAARLQLPTSWLRKRTAAGLIPHVRLGRHVRFSEDNLTAIIAQAARPPQS